jgi:hypothetical protein
VPVVGEKDLLWRSELRIPGVPRGAWWDPSPGLTPLGFSGEHELVATYTTPESKAPVSPWTVHCILLDAATGRILGQHEWSVLYHRVAVLPTDAGNFVFRENHELVLYPPTFRPLARFPLDSRRYDIRGFGYDVVATPGRKSIVVRKWLDRWVELTWLNPDSLTVERQWRIPNRMTGLFYSLQASRRFISELVPDGIFVSPIGGSPSRLPWPAQGWYRDAYFDSAQQFVSDNHLLLSRPGQVQLVRADGKVLFSKAVRDPEYTYANEAQLSADGSRLAISLLKTEGIDSELLNLSAHPVVKRIMIYDLPTMRLACQLDGKHPSTKYVTAMALSPDGSRVALLRAGAIELYKLPE